MFTISSFRGKSIALSLALLVHPLAARADEGTRPELARHELWLSISATLLTGAIAGSYALKVAALHDRIELLGPNSRERAQLQDDAVMARRWAWGFGSAASLLALTSAWVLVYQPAREPSLTPVVSANQLGLDYRGRF